MNMAENTRAARIPAPAALVGGGLVAAGIVLSMFGGMGFLILAGLGAFGPGILRELGWLNDQDEFQRQAARRAGYHAYLVGGFAAVLTVAAMKFREANIDPPATWIAFVLVILWATWLFSSLLAFWGAPKTTARVLMVYGAFWAVFVVADVVSEPSALGALMAVAFVAPYFLLAWMAGRWPRLTGILLIAISAIVYGWLFDFGREFTEQPSQILTFVLLLVPMISCGIALLRETQADDEE
jgi:hypothetical protein